MIEAAADRNPSDKPVRPQRPAMLSVEMLRGFAAVAVVIYHTYLILRQPQYGGIEIFGPVASHGWLGVNFFFVLSGFIIFYAHRTDIGRPESLPRYAWRRAVRIYPLYWVALTLYLIGASAGFGYPDFSMSPLNLAWSYGLIGLVEPMTLPLRVAWTLFYEVNFYAVFAVLLFSRKLGMAAITLWFGAILLANIIGWNSKFYLLHMWNLYFLVGITVNFAIPWLNRWQGLAALAAGVVGVVGLLSTIQKGVDFTESNPFVLLGLAAAFALVLLGAIVCERGWSLRPPKFLLLLGSASFSVYLFHSPVVSVLSQINHMLGHDRLPPGVLFILIATLATLVGVGVHILLERPMLSILRKMEPRLRLRHHGELVEKTP